MAVAVIGAAAVDGIEARTSFSTGKALIASGVGA
jgi:hypothetical protein